jgi:hypothetical protein
MKAVSQQTLPTTWKHRSPFFVAKPKLGGDAFGSNANTLFPFAASRRTEAIGSCLRSDHVQWRVIAGSSPNPMHWPIHQSLRCHAGSKRSGKQCRRAGG